MVTGVSLIIAVPLGFGIGLFAAEAAPAAMRRLLQPLLELLAGIPSVVYGFFGYVTLVKWFEVWFSRPTGESLLAAGIILAVMVLPFIASTSAEAFRVTFHEYQGGSAFSWSHAALSVLPSSMDQSPSRPIGGCGPRAGARARRNSGGAHAMR